VENEGEKIMEDKQKRLKKCNMNEPKNGDD
jgi:hypothetical protein